MGKLYLIITLILCGYIFLHTHFFKTISKGWKGKIFPGKRKATMFDIRNLILKGDLISAIRLYSEIFHTDTTEAKKAVDELARSIHEKNELE